MNYQKEIEDLRQQVKDLHTYIDYQRQITNEFFMIFSLDVQRKLHNIFEISGVMRDVRCNFDTTQLFMKCADEQKEKYRQEIKESMKKLFKELAN